MKKIIILFFILTEAVFGTERVSEINWKIYETAQIIKCLDRKKTTELINTRGENLTNICRNQIIAESLPLLYKLRKKDFLQKALESNNLASYLSSEFFKGEEDPVVIKVMLYELIFKIAKDNNQVNQFSNELMIKEKRK